MNLRKAFVCLSWTFFSFVHAKSRDTLPLLNETEIPQTHAEMWRGFDPREEPLETEILKEWEQDEVVLQVLRFRIGRFKGKKSMMAGVYGYPRVPRDYPVCYKFTVEGNMLITKHP
jgi:hypothetical protein